MISRGRWQCLTWKGLHCSRTYLPLRLWWSQSRRPCQKKPLLQSKKQAPHRASSSSSDSSSRQPGRQGEEVVGGKQKCEWVWVCWCVLHSHRADDIALSHNGQQQSVDPNPSDHGRKTHFYNKHKGRKMNRRSFMIIILDPWLPTCQYPHQHINGCLFISLLMKDTTQLGSLFS